jgi:hypothetical protein
MRMQTCSTTQTAEQTVRRYMLQTTQDSLRRSKSDKHSRTSIKSVTNCQLSSESVALWLME